MGPAQLAREAREVACCGDAASGTAAHVCHVGKIRSQAVLIVLPERKLPYAVPSFVSTAHDLVRERLVVGKQTARDVSEGDHARARESRDIHDDIRVEPLGVGQCVAQDQTPFCVGIQNFYRLSGHRFHDVARLDRGTARHVLAGGNQSDDIHRGLHRSKRTHSAKHARRAGHIELHLVHFRRRLEGYASGIEGDAFSDEHDRACVLAATLVLQHDQFGRLRRSSRYREQGAHAELLHVTTLEHFDADLELPREFARLIGKIGRGTHVGGKIAQRTR